MSIFCRSPFKGRIYSNKRLILGVALGILIVLSLSSFTNLEDTTEKTEKEIVLKLEPMIVHETSTEVDNKEIKGEFNQVIYNGIKLPINEIVAEIKKGKLGDGEDRKLNLIELGYTEEERNDIDLQLKKSIKRSNIKKKVVTNHVENNTKPQSTGSTEYARRIWEYLSKLNYTPNQIAAILGNIMSECGGQSLNINPYVGNSHYGICQWSRSYNLHGASFEKQLQFLGNWAKNIPDSDITTCTVWFCHELERPHRASCCYGKCNIRIKNAKYAYSYFMQ